MNPHDVAEALLRDFRKKLGYAHQLEVAGHIEEADGMGARAANNLAQAIHLTKTEDAA